MECRTLSQACFFGKEKKESVVTGVFVVYVNFSVVMHSYLKAVSFA